jgi:hypothetical protein
MFTSMLSSNEATANGLADKLMQGILSLSATQLERNAEVCEKVVSSTVKDWRAKQSKLTDAVVDSARKSRGDGPLPADMEDDDL